MTFLLSRRLAVPIVTAALLATCLAGVTVVGQTGPPSSLIIKSVSGRDLFEFYCATCHGRDAKGAGPVAEALRVPPPDLTLLAVRGAGAFPASRVESVITDGRDMPTAHGSPEMPVWGPIFRGLDPNDRLNHVRLRNIVEYLASIQVHSK